MQFSKILKEKYEKCNDKTKELFTKIINESMKYCISGSAINMKEYQFRLQKHYIGRGRKKQNFCLFTLAPSKNGITIHLRAENLKINSDILKIDTFGSYSYLSGDEWIKFRVFDINQAEEALRLIKYAFDRK